ncbi:hypothetical protein RDI58_007175 [Solanum bulbocastanum]|uniref:Uncharacterized protein n=1 Tax=Solanum bulbocastanum TaxID=147425 RepID=A0AAN8YIM4_SOLBU
MISVVEEDVVMSKITYASQLVDESGESLTIDFQRFTWMKWVGLRRHIYMVLVLKQFSMRTLVRHLLQLLNLKIVILMIEMKEEMKHAMREEMREELREEMKNEMQLEMQEQVDKILLECLSTLIAGLPKPPHGTPPSGTPH